MNTKFKKLKSLHFCIYANAFYFKTILTYIYIFKLPTFLMLEIIIQDSIINLCHSNNNIMIIKEN